MVTAARDALAKVGGAHAAVEKRPAAPAASPEYAASAFDQYMMPAEIQKTGQGVAFEMNNIAGGTRQFYQIWSARADAKGTLQAFTLETTDRSLLPLRLANDGATQDSLPLTQCTLAAVMKPVPKAETHRLAGIMAEAGIRHVAGADGKNVEVQTVMKDAAKTHAGCIAAASLTRY